VYKEVCATCHSLDGIRYGQLVNTILLEDEAKRDAAEHEVLFKAEEFKSERFLTDILFSTKMGLMRLETILPALAS
jgi:cytochrome c1